VTTQLSTKQASQALGIGKSRVLQLIKAKRLPAEQVGNQFVIKRKDLARVRDRKPGRPPAAKRRGRAAA
jgi:excisionase family DNA binding protein